MARRYARQPLTSKCQVSDSPVPVSTLAPRTLACIVEVIGQEARDVDKYTAIEVPARPRPCGSAMRARPGSRTGGEMPHCVTARAAGARRTARLPSPAVTGPRWKGDHHASVLLDQACRLRPVVRHRHECRRVGKLLA